MHAPAIQVRWVVGKYDEGEIITDHPFNGWSVIFLAEDSKIKDPTILVQIVDNLRVISD